VKADGKRAVGQRPNPTAAGRGLRIEGPKHQNKIKDKTKTFYERKNQKHLRSDLCRASRWSAPKQRKNQTRKESWRRVASLPPPGSSLYEKMLGSARPPCSRFGRYRKSGLRNTTKSRSPSRKRNSASRASLTIRQSRSTPSGIFSGARTHVAGGIPVPVAASAAAGASGMPYRDPWRFGSASSRPRRS
jgi:hypothetical protein